MKKLLYTLSVLVSIVLLAGSYWHKMPFSLMEMIGFVTGAYCVWLAVIENIWNWPIGILNAVAFTVLFLQSKLYADAGLQIVYIILGFVGWYWWLKGGRNKSKLQVNRISVREALLLLGLGVIASIGFVKFLASVGDVAPLWDGITTISSLIAQYMLTRKYFENWHVWIATDVIYIGLYGFKHLVLTAILYVIFMAMCIVGVRDWRKQLPHKQTNKELVIGAQEA